MQRMSRFPPGAAAFLALAVVAAGCGVQGRRPSPQAAPAPSPGNGKVLYREEPKSTAAADRNLPYDVVKVYYATDRAVEDVFQWRQTQRRGWPLWTALFFALFAMLMLVRRRGKWVRALAWCSLAAGTFLLGLTLAYRWQPAPIDEGIERMYGGDRGELELGVCSVSVPRDHRVGELESPSVLRLEFRPDPERHVVLVGVHPQPADVFFAGLRACVEQSPRKEAFVFIHGYNVGFETAVRRTAQIAYDLKFSGAPIVYSWPSRESLIQYTVDEQNVAWTVPHLVEFLSGVAERSGATSVHLIAHSMGNRALTAALRELAMVRKDAGPRFHEVVLRPTLMPTCFDATSPRPLSASPTALRCTPHPTTRRLSPRARFTAIDARGSRAKRSSLSPASRRSTSRKWTPA